MAHVNINVYWLDRDPDDAQRAAFAHAHAKAAKAAEAARKAWEALKALRQHGCNGGDYEEAMDQAGEAVDRLEGVAEELYRAGGPF